jgi:cytochrome c biogenesis protein CcdA
MIDERRHSLLGLTLAVAAGIVLGTLSVGLILTVIGAVFHLVGWLFRVALIAAVVVGVWYLIIGRRRAHD